MPALWSESLFCLLIVRFYLMIIAQIDGCVQGKCLKYVRAKAALWHKES